ncbi:MAG: indolepyruvate ferredoxin oxidoreductase family protein [Gammaproteobacteria bacterium]
MTGGNVLETASLDDKYRLDAARALISGRQALVRLLLLQRALDRRDGLNSAGFVSGYRGSPLGGFDAELWKAEAMLRAHDIRFQPGLNEDLAMTAVAGSQQIGFLPGRKVDGVFGLWYGKGPGVDRSGDAIKHANLSGVSATGGVVLVVGDDHAGKSSTTAHQSELTLASWGVPVLYPSSVTEILTLGLAAFAMSRFTGSLVALKLVNETAEGTGVVTVDQLPHFVKPQLAEPPGGVHIRAEVLAVQAQDARLVRHKLPRARAFANANRLDYLAYGAAAPRFMIATAGKAYADVLAALRMLRIDDEIAKQAGIGVYKIGLVYPLDPIALIEAARVAEEILFVEEKKANAEPQTRDIFYHRSPRPRVTGKTTPDGVALLPEDRVLDSLSVAIAIAERLEASFPGFSESIPAVAEALAALRATSAGSSPQQPVAVRRPGFCPGCPHNSSTVIPEGAFGATGIGCHGMVRFHSDRYPLPMGHMGAEGANWIGLAPFTETTHIFQNLGDGTYSHSGSLAIRAAVVAGVNITYKILYNDAVAMTGGQPVEGGLTVSRIVQQVRAEGASRVVVLSEDPERFESADSLPPNTELYVRDELGRIQQALRIQPGVSVIIFDQVCAAEKRRRRKINAFPDPDRRVFINAQVCEGCGDCSVQSNCLAIQPLETELGRKRRIDQSACNKDISCLKGFCPAFVTVAGARPRRAAAVESDSSPLPEPTVPPIGAGFNMMITGVGGTGVVTVGAIVGMAARLQGFGASLYDMTGLSQKGGAVFSHVRLSADADALLPARIGPGESDVLLACDVIAAVHPEVTSTVKRNHTLIVANADIMATADFQVQRDLTVPQAKLLETLTDLAGVSPRMFAATQLAENVLGDSIAANIVMLGYAWQCGRIPLTLQALEQAIQLNGRAAEANRKAFRAGRARALAEAPGPTPAPPDLDAFIERRTRALEDYWNRAYAHRYATLMRAVRDAARPLEGGERFAWAAARAACKLMAYKDEYEVARLYSNGTFREALRREFEGELKVRIFLSPPGLVGKDPRTGRTRKISVGSWIFPVFRVLAACRGLRETPLDVFGRTAERRLERRLRDAFLARLKILATELNQDNMAAGIELAESVMQVRGFGPVKAPAADALLSRLQPAVK